MHFIEPANRHQFVFINKLDDMVEPNHYVRFIDQLVDKIVDEHVHRFLKKGGKSIGRRAYSANTLLKLYIYGYFNGISSSRKLEKESRRNIELIWLLGHLTPDFKTIADFRKDNPDEISFVFNQMNHIFKDRGLIGGQTISIDGTKMRIDASKVINLEHIPEKLKNLNEQLSAYIHLLHSNDQQDEQVDALEQQEAVLMEKIDFLKDQIEQLERQKKFLEKQNIKRYSPTDPEARMMKSRQGTGLHYNVQMAVDQTNHLITTVKTTSKSNDKGLLVPVLEQLEEELNIVPENAIADSGYYVLNQIEQLEKEKHINCYVPININSSQANDRNNQISFDYDEHNDKYICSQGHDLTFVTSRNDKRRGSSKVYKAKDCLKCAVKPMCTKSSNRSIHRYNNNKWREAYQQKMQSKSGKQMLRKRQYLSERPFARIKYLSGSRLKLKTTSKVQTEMILYSMAYNLQRILSVQPIEQLIKSGKQNLRKIAA